MQFVNANIAKGVARLHDWPDRVWSLRYRAIPSSTTRLLTPHPLPTFPRRERGPCRNGRFLARPQLHRCLTHGDRIQGTWHDRSAEYRARAAGKKIKPGDFTTSYDVKLTSLPCIVDKSIDQQQAHYRRVVREIDAAAADANADKKRTRWASRPSSIRILIIARCPDRSPAPLVHAHDARSATRTCTPTTSSSPTSALASTA